MDRQHSRGSPHERVMRLAKLVHDLRIERHMSQSKVARYGHIGASTINQLEAVMHGGPLIGMPNPDTLRAIARGLATNGLGARDCEQARQLHDQLMAEIGYCDPPPPEVISIPRDVLEKLAELSDADIELGLTGRPWTSQDTANILRVLDEALRRKRGRDGGANSNSA